MITVYIYRQNNHSVVTDASPTAELIASLAEGDVAWIHVAGAEASELDAVFRHAVPVHELVLADIERSRNTEVEGLHHPKVEDYRDYLFVIVHALATASIDEHPKFVQLNMVVGERFLVTQSAFPIDGVTEAATLCGRSQRNLERGPDYIMHLILDGVVDGFVPLMDNIEDKLEHIEHGLLDKPTRETLLGIVQLKRHLLALRRVLMYMREIANRLSRGEFDLISQDETAYYRNVYDHLVRAVDRAESCRDLVMSIMDVYFSMSSTKMNEIMKVLTVISTIFLPLTFISSIYGMNFHYMPELESAYGYPLVLLVLAALGIGMFLFFRKRGWLA